MTRMSRLAIPALMAAIPLGIVLPALAQQNGGRQSGDVDQAKQIVTLIEQGQLDLAAATQVAEKHVKGNALKATCEIVGTAEKSDGNRKPGGPTAGQNEQPSGQRLVYSITCYAKDKVQVVRVDGKSHKVIEDNRKTPS